MYTCIVIFGLILDFVCLTLEELRSDMFQLSTGGCGGWTLMGSAASSNKTELIQLFYDHRNGEFNLDKVDIVNQGNEFGWTPLFCAVAYEPNVEACQLLLKLGADKTLATTMSCGDTERGDTPREMTPLAKCKSRVESIQAERIKYMSNVISNKTGFDAHVCKMYSVKDVLVAECTHCPKIVNDNDVVLSRYQTLCEMLS